MQELADSWKNSDIFKCQLDLNLKELSSKSKYPLHWLDFIKLVNKSNAKTILDIGCGCGAYYKLCGMELKDLKYVGIDYSSEAIDLAKKQWGYNDFYVMAYNELTKEYVSGFDLLHLGGFLDILSNGDEVLDFIVSLKAKNIIIGRITFTTQSSFYSIYQAYNKISTYKYRHNKENFERTCNKYGYSFEILNDSCLLIKDE